MELVVYSSAARMATNNDDEIDDFEHLLTIRQRTELRSSINEEIIQENMRRKIRERREKQHHIIKISTNQLKSHLVQTNNCIQLT